MGGVEEKLTPRGSSGSQKKTASKRNRVKAVSSAWHPPEIPVRPPPPAPAPWPAAFRPQSPGPRHSEGGDSRTRWLRSVTPADLKSGNLMPAVSGTAWGRRSYGDQGVTGRGPSVSPSPLPAPRALRALHPELG